MESPLSLSIFFFFFLNLLVLSSIRFPVAEAGQRRVHIPDELDDVVDDEEDEDWKQWGTSKSPFPDFGPPPDLSNMDMAQIQAEMMKRQLGPSFGFVKLRLGDQRDMETVYGIAKKWNKVLKTGGVEATMNAVDLNTIMFTLMRGQDAMELKEFLLDQDEAYEVKIGDSIFRRPGDPSLDEIVEKQYIEKQQKARVGVKDESRDEL